ncbi:hypothetical protein MIR68_010592 [Amoeboaphelidium protococcarum]|nr:hypothetical protein MIR68_010592 [Amoeboaphelidium protococcarum]
MIAIPDLFTTKMLSFAFILGASSFTAAINGLTLESSSVNMQGTVKLCGLQSFAASNAPKEKISYKYIEPFHLEFERNEMQIGVYICLPEYFFEAQNAGAKYKVQISTAGNMLTYVEFKKASPNWGNKAFVTIDDSIEDCKSVSYTIKTDESEKLLMVYKEHLKREARASDPLFHPSTLQVDEYLSDAKVTWKDANGEDLTDGLPISRFPVAEKSRFFRGLFSHHQSGSEHHYHVQCDYMDKDLALLFTSCLNHNRIGVAGCQKGLVQELGELSFERLVKFIMCTDQFEAEGLQKAAKLALMQRLAQIELLDGIKISQMIDQLVEAISVLARLPHREVFDMCIDAYAQLRAQAV